MTSEELNEGIRKICDAEEYCSEPAQRGGKVIPYVGWYWRNVDFDKPFVLHKPKHGSFDVPTWYGFMEKNKWGYDEVRPSAKDCALIRAALSVLVVKPSKEAADLVFQTIQDIGARS